jgi:hypothetical protein
MSGRSSTPLQHVVVLLNLVAFVVLLVSVLGDDLFGRRLLPYGVPLIVIGLVLAIGPAVDWASRTPLRRWAPIAIGVACAVVGLLEALGKIRGGFLVALLSFGCAIAIFAFGVRRPASALPPR